MKRSKPSKSNQQKNRPIQKPSQNQLQTLTIPNETPPIQSNPQLTDESTEINPNPKPLEASNSFVDSTDEAIRILEKLRISSQQVGEISQEQMQVNDQLQEDEVSSSA